LVPIFYIVMPQSEHYIQTVRFTFAFHRAELVGKHSSLQKSIPRRRDCLIGAFFNGVFLLALALSIFLQSLERFVHVERIEKPFSVLVIGCIGLTLNIISALVIHGTLFLALDTQLCWWVDIPDHHGHGGHNNSHQTPLIVPESNTDSPDHIVRFFPRDLHFHVLLHRKIN